MKKFDKLVTKCQKLVNKSDKRVSKKRHKVVKKGLKKWNASRKIIQINEKKWGKVTNYWKEK